MLLDCIKSVTSTYRLTIRRLNKDTDHAFYWCGK